MEREKPGVKKRAWALTSSSPMTRLENDATVVATTATAIPNLAAEPTALQKVVDIPTVMAETECCCCCCCCFCCCCWARVIGLVILGLMTRNGDRLCYPKIKEVGLRKDKEVSRRRFDEGVASAVSALG